MVVFSRYQILSLLETCVKPLPPPRQKKDPRYPKIWKIVDGAVRDALKMHPHYVQRSLVKSLRYSIAKRVVGQVLAQDKSSPKGVGPVKG